MDHGLQCGASCDAILGVEAAMTLFCDTPSMTIYDLHTHQLSHNAIVAAEPPAGSLSEDYLYSVGIHPWHIPDNPDFDRLQKICSQPNVVAIGECGLDRLTDSSLDLQEEIFIRHIDISRQLRKPMIIHCVRAFDRLLAIHRQTLPSQPWIIHGFRQNPALTAQLLEKGIDISLGPRFNSETARIIPADRLFIETDDDPSVSILQVAAAVAEARHTTAENILSQVASNARRLLNIL